MRVSKYIVTAINCIESDGITKKLAIVPSESLPEQRNSTVRNGGLARLLAALSGLSAVMNEDNNDRL